MKFLIIWIILTILIAGFYTYLGDYKGIKETLRHFFLYTYIYYGVAFLILFIGGLIFYNPKEDKEYKSKLHEPSDIYNNFFGIKNKDTDEKK
ncbi:hypothetical protein SAMN04487898_105126 [Pedobacter sp. ok626]|uniref:hypothetical protein n=1 Tax=Pedobacter sp. ok626 TaxID=1761882 RepID=UPI000886010E|nr:hypothetical protein [Pedobacter sp. ok626]SDJ94814.1 hypothetical protein SAMN04487898_105126 [Pedobacter sp. ok626]